VKHEVPVWSIQSTIESHLAGIPESASIANKCFIVTKCFIMRETSSSLLIFLISH
jgi:hypothetical protein